MIAIIKKLIAIAKAYDADQRGLEQKISAVNRKTDEAVQTIRDRTGVSADISYSGPSSIIMVGRYKGVDFIQTYTLDDATFMGLVQELRYKEQFATVRTVDAPPQVKVTVKRGLMDF